MNDKKIVIITILVIVAILVYNWYIINVYAVTSNARGQCEHWSAYRSENGTITDPEPYFEIYFWGDKEVKWCDEKL